MTASAALSQLQLWPEDPFNGAHENSRSVNCRTYPFDHRKFVHSTKDDHQYFSTPGLGSHFGVGGVGPPLHLTD